MGAFLRCGDDAAEPRQDALPDTERAAAGKGVSALTVPQIPNRTVLTGSGTDAMAEQTPAAYFS